MREILFRGKREDNNEWAYGSHLLDDISGKHYIIPFGNINESDKEGQERCCYCVGFEVIPETVGQYTGLTDKNCKKIFEGDIVKDHESGLYGEVVFATAQDGFDGMSGFMVDDINDGLQNYNGFWHLVEIIGNIHDNPKLLKEAEW